MTTHRSKTAPETKTQVTPAQLETLKELAKPGAFLVHYERYWRTPGWFIAGTSTKVAIVKLEKEMLIKRRDTGSEDYDIAVITDAGRAVLERYAPAPETGPQ